MEGSDSNGRTRLHKKVSLKTRSLYLQSRTDRVLECMKFDHSLSPNKRQRAAILGHDPFTASPELKTLGNAIKCQTLLQPLAAHDPEPWRSCHPSTTGGAATPCTFFWLDAFTCLSEFKMTLITGSSCHSVTLPKRDPEEAERLWTLNIYKRAGGSVGCFGDEWVKRTKQVLRKNVQRLPKSLKARQKAQEVL